MPDNDWAIAEIVAVSRTRNAALDVTGVLVATSGHFAQILEGRVAALDELMESIRGDSRHTDITVLRSRAISRRQFPTWSMAYSGPSTYMARHVGPLIGGDLGKDKGRVDQLIALMTGLAGS